MAKADDLSQKAAEFLKHWQAQMTRSMHDSDVIAAMLAAMKNFGAKTHDETARKPADAPDAGHDAIRKLERRIDALEHQLAQFLSVVTQTKNPAGTGKRSRTKPVAKRQPAMGGSKRGVAKKPVAGRKPATRSKKK